MELKPVIVNLKHSSQINFEQLDKDIKLRKHTIKITSCGLCNYNCKECGVGNI